MIWGLDEAEGEVAERVRARAGEEEEAFLAGFCLEMVFVCVDLSEI